MSRAREFADLAGSVDAGGLTGRNLIINGAMQVAQRSTGTVTVANDSNEGYSTVDRFSVNMNAGVGGALDISQSTDTPAGFSNSVKLKCQTTNTDYSGTKFVELRHKIEAQNLQLLGFGTSSAKPITVSWYMKTVNYTGPISLSLQTQDGTAQYYAKSITPTTSWARYTCTIPGSTSATINNDSGSGMTVDFVLAGGSSGTNAASSDSTGFSTTRVDYIDDIGNLLANTSNEIYITGVQLEVGEQATPFEHRSFADELASCQRYHYRIDADAANDGLIGALANFNGTSSYGVLSFPVEMRTAPSAVTSADNTFTFYSQGQTRTPTNVTVAARATKATSEMHIDWSSSLNDGGAGWLRAASDSALIGFDAEL